MTEYTIDFIPKLDLSFVMKLVWSKSGWSFYLMINRSNTYLLKLRFILR